jgi:protein-tyrosine phosphatase
MTALPPESPRRLPLSGAVNFRDLGGYDAGPGRRTRWNRVYRSDSLADLTADDQAAVAGLGIRTLIDFRLPQERARKPNRLPPGAPIRSIELGFIPRGALEMLAQAHAGAVTVEEIDALVTAQYRLFPEEHRDIAARVLQEVLAAAGEPLLIHCASGKDRTGFAAATILMAAGVPRATIMEDYLLTNAFRRDVAYLFSPETPKEVIDALTGARREYLEAAFDAIDRAYGSGEAYLRQALGLSDRERSLLVDLLTEPA